MSEKGFTMIELVIVTALASVIMAGTAMLLMPMMRAQIDGAAARAAQANALFALRGLRADLVQTTFLARPAAGSAGDILSGCTNFDAARGVIDAASPAQSFYYCETGGRLFRYSQPANWGCPMPPPRACGEGQPMTLTAGLSHLNGSYFTRPENDPVSLEMRFVGEARGKRAEVDTTVAYLGAR